MEIQKKKENSLNSKIKFKAIKNCILSKNCLHIKIQKIFSMYPKRSKTACKKPQKNYAFL